MPVGIWNQIQDELKTKIDPESFEAWFGKVEIEERKNILILWVPTLFHKDWLDNHYKDNLASSAAKHNGGTAVDIRVLCKQEAGRSKSKLGSKGKSGLPSRSSGRESSPAAFFLNPLYTFDSFVVGPSNQFAHAACLAVAEAPAKIYNPLFIYGGVGLGKTHLMQAIGHQILRDHPETKALYVSAETFTNEFVEAIRNSRTDTFHKKYRQVELLLIDDIQFLANKERSQEEFFHTFNTLYEGHRQLVITSDRPPKEIATIQDRLRSRLEWGLITDIQPPNLETRIAILRKKADEADLDVPNDCIDYIATKVRSNIRELEGALMRVGAMATLSNRRIDMPQTQEALKALVELRRDGRITIDMITKTVCEYFKVTSVDLKSKRRTSDVALPRQIAMYMCREITQQSLPVIGMEYGGRDHTTVLHSCNKISALVERDRHLQNIVQDLRTTLAIS